MKTSEISLIGQYIKDLSFENPMAPNLPSQNKNPTVSLDVNTTYLDLKNNNHEVNLKINSTASIDKNTLFALELQYVGLIKAVITPSDFLSSFNIFPSGEIIIE